MSLTNIIQRLHQTKVLENYAFMTALQVFSALISLIIYPYVIRTVGAASYGAYVFALTIIGYFQILTDFGFDSPCAKRIVDNKDNNEKKSEILSAVFTAKHILLIPTTIEVFFALLQTA